MDDSIIDFAKRVRSKYEYNVGNVLEIGSYNVNGTIRDAFQDGSRSYIGIDSQVGPCVDLVMDAEKLSDVFLPGSFDTIVCCECLEHTVRPWVVVEAMRKLLKPGGMMFISTPTFEFRLHRYPIDCYRFGEDAYRLFMFEGFDILELEHVHPTIIACAGILR